MQGHEIGKSIVEEKPLFHTLKDKNRTKLSLSFTLHIASFVIATDFKNMFCSKDYKQSH